MYDTIFSKPKLILFSFIAILLTLFCLELCARIVLAYNKGSLRYLMYGIVEIKEKQRLQRYEGKGGDAEYYKSTPSNDPNNPVNSRGFRGPEIKEKKSGIKRIVCLGSSTTYGEGLIFADTYPAILQHKLDQAVGSGKYEVINAGQPGLNLAQILSLLKQEILSLQPDMIILMNINNNFKAPGFWFVDMKGRDIKGTRTEERFTFLINIRNKLVQYCACARLIHDYQYQGIARYFINFDWKSFSESLTAPDNIWEKEFTDNLEKLLTILYNHNPAIGVILIEEAVNHIRYPELRAPFNKACEIMRAKAKKHKNVFIVNVENDLLDAVKRGESVWQAPMYDPLHLVKRGNEIIANAAFNAIKDLK